MDVVDDQLVRPSREQPDDTVRAGCGRAVPGPPAADARRPAAGESVGQLDASAAVRARRMRRVATWPVRRSVARQNAQPSVARTVAGVSGPSSATFTASPAEDSDGYGWPW